MFSVLRYNNIMHHRNNLFMTYMKSGYNFWNRKKYCSRINALTDINTQKWTQLSNPLILEYFSHEEVELVPNQNLHLYSLVFMIPEHILQTVRRERKSSTYSVCYQMRTLNTNPPTDHVIYNNNLLACYAGTIVTKALWE